MSASHPCLERPLAAPADHREAAVGPGAGCAPRTPPARSRPGPWGESAGARMPPQAAGRWARRADPSPPFAPGRARNAPMAPFVRLPADWRRSCDARHRPSPIDASDRPGVQRPQGQTERKHVPRPNGREHAPNGPSTSAPGCRWIGLPAQGVSGTEGSARAVGLKPSVGHADRQQRVDPTCRAPFGMRVARTYPGRGGWSWTCRG